MPGRAAVGRWLSRLARLSRLVRLVRRALGGWGLLPVPTLAVLPVTGWRCLAVPAGLPLLPRRRPVPWPARPVLGLTWVVLSWLDAFWRVLPALPRYWGLGFRIIA